MKRIVLIAVFALLASGLATAQRMPERHLVRKGNRQFGNKLYDKSIESYTRATEAAPTSFEAAFNLANAQLRAERYDAAEKGLARLAADSTLCAADRADAAYNLGNAQFAQKKLKEALGSYRQAMRLNPDDKEAKFNYAYTKRLLEQQEQNQNKDDNNKDNQNKDSQDQQQQGKDDQKQDGDQNNENSGKDDRQGDNKEQQGQPQEQQQDGQDEGQNGEGKPSSSGISDREREAMLEAIQAQEDKTQDKLKEKAGVVVRGGKNW